MIGRFFRWLFGTSKGQGSPITRPKVHLGPESQVLQGVICQEPYSRKVDHLTGLDDHFAHCRLASYHALAEGLEPPHEPGIYAWFFDQMPDPVPTFGCFKRGP